MKKKGNYKVVSYGLASKRGYHAYIPPSATTVGFDGKATELTRCHALRALRWLEEDEVKYMLANPHDTPIYFKIVSNSHKNGEIIADL